MAVVINGSGTVTGLSVGGLPDGTVDAGTLATDSVTAVKIPDTVEANLKSGRKNLIINGAMQVAQRGTSETGQGASDLFLLDRFYLNTNGNSAGRYTVTQTADGPSGFANCMKLACTTADTTIGSAERLFIEQRLEGQDLQQIKKGTGDAEEITVSFYVKGNASATYVLGLYESDNGRQVGSQFSVTTSWTKVEVTFPADTTGALDDDNAESLSLRLYLHAGSNYTSGTLATTWGGASASTQVGSGTTSFFDSTDRTFYITGVQLEVGSTATDFEHRSYGEELTLCERYYQNSFMEGKYPGVNTEHGNAVCTTAWSDGNATGPLFRTSMRATPTATIRPRAATGNTGYTMQADSYKQVTSIAIGSKVGTYMIISGATAGSFTCYSWELDAEL